MISLRELWIKFSIECFNDRCRHLQELTDILRCKLHEFCYDFQSNHNVQIEQVKQFIVQIEILTCDSNLLFLTIDKTHKDAFVSTNIRFWDGWVNISIQEQTLLEEIIVHQTNMFKLTEIIDLLCITTK